MNLPKLNILIVEDENEFRINLGSLLQEEFPGSAVREAGSVEDGKKALDRSAKEGGDRAGIQPPFDIVLLDFRLPVDGGGQEIDVSLCDLARTSHPDSLVIHVTANAKHPEAARHMQAVHQPWLEKAVSGDHMETQHLGIVISKGTQDDAEGGTQGKAERLGQEIVDAITKRARLKAIDANLDAVLGKESTWSPGGKHVTGRIVVPDTSLTGCMASLSLALEEDWDWLPERTKARARKLFTIREIKGSPSQIHIQLL